MNIDSALRDSMTSFLKINKYFAETLKKIKSDTGQKGVSCSSTKEDEEYKSLFYFLATEMFLDPQCFNEIFQHFYKHLPQLLQLALFSNPADLNETRHILKTILLGKIVNKRKDLGGYALKYFTKNPEVLEKLEVTEIAAKKRKISDIPFRDLHFVESCYHLLKNNPDFYRYKWNWSIFIQKYLEHQESQIKWMSCQIVAILFGMNEKQTKKLILQFLTEELNITYSCIFNLHGKFIDSNIQTNLQSPVSQLPNEVIDDLISISGIYIPVLSKVSNINSHLIEVPSTVNNLRKVALGLTLNKAVCLQGPVGSGKTSLVEYFAEKTGRNLGENFVKVQLGDQTDSKMLLGTYRCTDIPGEFVWQPGVLTQAVLEGNWLLLEDIDSASMDIASMLTSLLENNCLTVPGYRDSVPITPGFQLFVTHRFVSTISGHHKKHSNSMSLLEKHLLQINIDPLTTDELKQILDVKYPEFRTISDRLVRVFLLFTRDVSDLTQVTIPKIGRLISTRDFFKWCSRSIQNFDVKSQASALKVLQDAIDVFCCSYSDQKDALNLAKQISTQLGIINEKADYFFKDYKPTMQLTSDYLVAGRVALKRDNSEFLKRMPFCFTRPSAVLLERIMCCVNLKEPVLLVGETGTGKTSCVQYLAHIIGQKLVVINMNQQSDSADLLGGFKPVDIRQIIAPVRKEFEHVFADFFNVEPNRKYLSNLALCFNNQRYADLVKLMTVSYQAAYRRLQKSIENFETDENNKNDEEKVSKYEKDLKLFRRWCAVGENLQKLKVQLKHTNALAFAFIKGSLVRAVEKGYWVLLDEINLANAETLECLSGLLEGSQGSLCLLERGDKKPVVRHQNFTLFACMNPSTDVGKKDLPAGLRNRFTEFFVEELNDKNDLLLLVNNYLEAMSLKPNDLESIVNFYLKVRQATVLNLSDGLGHKPHYSLRSLCRALMIASKNPCGMFKRSLYEAFCLSFLTQLDSSSYETVKKLIASYLIGDAKSIKAVLNQPISRPEIKQEEYLPFEGYWVTRGHLEPSVPEDYILTASVRKNLKDLVRVVSIGRLPVLLQGDTSVGKTSLITYLAKSSGNKCVRINNHEHTDLQEYIGSYVADTDGKLIFREGLLVEAMRKGHWIILDELNLAPTDVLEALNRVLDDNRELFIPETQETVQAHANFMLFATQNPPGTYGGRKMLSRAFRNRFVELHFNEIPPKELETILHQRCQMAPSYAKKMINVMTDLQMRRRGSAAFAGKQGFITLRDLFRWGERYRLAQNSKKLYDWDQHLADEGYLVLAGKVRRSEERCEIIEVLQKHLKREVDPEHLFTLSERTSTVTRHILKKIEENKSRYQNIVWTFNMRQLAVLISKALEFKEPVLLVGETGGGKTTVCKLIAENNGQELVTVNCHMHTESSDFIGGLRPVRDHSNEDSTKLFEWVDGPLITAMVDGNVFLADEISLADDSVLERLNSLLEPERTLLLAEKGIDLNNRENSELVVANTNFYFIGTMNPGGDFGKKELSPALRNRFTEIWCESCRNRQDLVNIIEQNVKSGLSMGNQQDASSGVGISIMDFLEWFEITEVGKRFTISIRDILTWVNFLNTCSGKMNISEAYIHGACLTFLDSLGSGVTSTESVKSLDQFKERCMQFLLNQVAQLCSSTIADTFDLKDLKVETIDGKFGIRPFYIETNLDQATVTEFTFTAPTTVSNTLRLLRGMQLNKAILLEGSPGVGKTSLVTAVAKFTGHKLFRINLSDQTDISDLFGADLPVEGGTGGQFSWRDGPLLQALKDGSWILLDELNLASQSVLEGLNACLDHRGEIFIPELGKTFYVKPGTRFFGCQNPLKQGGSRRGLPQSFLNRFIQVYVNSLTDKDFIFILTNQFNQLPVEVLSKMVAFNSNVVAELDNHTFGHKGAPWECNLRDLTRWCEATIYHRAMSDDHRPENVVQLIYGDRMRTLADKKTVRRIFEKVFGCAVSGAGSLVYVTDDKVFFGDVSVERNSVGVDANVMKQETTCLVMRSQSSLLRSLTYCINLNWMAILVGTTGSGKSSVVKTLASLAGKTLKTLPVTSAMDTTDILGGFEQTDYSRHLDEIARELERISLEIIQKFLLEGKNGDALRLIQHWEAYRRLSAVFWNELEDAEIKLFLRKISKLQDILQSFSLEYVEEIVKSLEEKLAKLSHAIKKESSLNAGGKFEWVDSVLIKCLQDGSWLMIDNVNLCSSAVLDRLNALLEPNGVLTVSERGVDAEGQMVEIKPHKDFRLFLTMDPKNGEISRAMRNRGIEIYLLNEMERQQSQDIDKISIVQLEGLNSFHANILIKLHATISDLIIGEKPNINELVQVATLVAQQLKYAVDVNEIFTNTILEIYFKTRSANEFSCNDFPNLIKDEICKCLNDDTSLTPSCFNKNSTITTQQLYTNSSLGKIQQQSVILFDYLEKKITSLQEISTELIFHLFSYYSITSLEDLTVRHAYLKEKLKCESRLKQELVEAISYITDKIHKFLSAYPLTAFPVDHNWVPEIYQKEKFIKSPTVNLTLWHNLITYLDIIKLVNNSNGTAQLKEGNVVLKTLTKKDPKVTLYQYACLKKAESYKGLFSDVIINNFIDLMKEHDVFMPVIFSCAGNVNNEDVIQMLYCLFFKSKFFQQFNLLLSRPINAVKLQSTITELRVYYKWFYKRSVVRLAGLANATVPDDLEEILAVINAKLHTQFSVTHKIGKNYQKCDNRPPPFTNQMQHEIVKEFIEISEQYDTSRKGNDMVKILTLFKKFKGLRTSLTELKAELDYDFNIEDRKLELLSTIKSIIREKVGSESEDIKFDLQLLPIMDVLLHMDLNMRGSSSFQNSMLLPVDLNGAMILYQKTKDDRLLHEIYKSYYMYKMHSPSVIPNKFLNGKEIELNEFSPKLTYLMSNFLVNVENVTDLGKITLGNSRHVMKQYEILNLTLWGNLYQISEEKYSFIYREFQNVRNIYTTLLNHLGASLQIDYEGIELKQLSINICNELRSKNCKDEKEITNLVVKLTQCSDVFEQIEKISEFDRILVAIATCYQNISHIKSMLNSQLSAIDPLAKKTLKRHYLSEASEMFELLKVCYENLNNIYSGRSKTRHHYCKPIEELLRSLTAEHEELSKYVAYRPENVLYTSVCEAINHAFSTILTDDFIEKVDDSNIERIIREKSNKVASYENLIHELNQFRSSFPDIIEPLVSNISEFLYGFKLYLGALKMQEAKIKQSKALPNTECSDVLVTFIKFPGPYEEENMRKVKQMVQFFLRNIEWSEKQELFRLLKLQIVESVNTAIVHSRSGDILNKKNFMCFNGLLEIFVNVYNKQQEDKEVKIKEMESLYKIKTKCDDKPEEQQIKEDLQKLFPNYHTLDFADFQESLDREEQTEGDQETKYEEVVTYNDLKEITQMHVRLLSSLTRTEWLNPNKNENLLTPDFVSPLLEKFKTFSRVLEETIHSVNSKMDESLIGSLNVLLAVKKRYGNYSELVKDVQYLQDGFQKKNDFYTDSNVDEVNMAYAILHNLKKKIEDLLDQWPDQPTLKTIVTVIERIFKFDITSPISRFLTGFEILLTKCHEWEEVAHSGVSISEYTQELTHQIVSWRKMELSMWKDLLNKVYERLNEPLPKWWLHLFNVMNQFVIEKKLGKQELVETLQSFMTKSNLAEYQGRLDLLYAFHCHAIYYERTTQSESFINIVWNIYSYFSQFKDVVFKKIKDLRSPIEKKLKDYVKIVRWKDINYWAIKDTVEKSHKTLHKFMREFQDVLEQPVTPFLHNFDSDNNSEKSEKPEDYFSGLVLEPEDIKNYENFKLALKDSKHPGVTAHDYVQQIMTSASYPKLVQTMDEFINEVIETSCHLRDLEIDTTLPRDKQKSQAKNILQQKHRALADLFKQLSMMGLSYKTGIIDGKIKDPTSDFVIKPINLQNQFTHEIYGYRESKLLNFWENSEKYYVRTLMRMDVLETAVQNPAKDLGMHNIERLKGFSQNMLTSIQKQKHHLVSTSRTYYYLKYYIKQIKTFGDSKCDSKQYLKVDLIDSITNLLTNITTIMTQYQILINTCPDTYSEDLEIPILQSNSEKRITCKHDQLWMVAKNCISSNYTVCNKLISQLTNSKGAFPAAEYQLNFNHYVSIADLDKLIDDLSILRRNILNISEVFGNIELTKHLSVLAEEIDEILNAIRNQETFIEETVYNFKQSINKFSKKIKSVIKKMNNKLKDSHTEPEEEKDVIKEEHLTTLLMEKLSSDILELDMNTVLNETKTLAERLLCSPFDKIEERKEAANDVIPVLEQLGFLYRYFIAQQVLTYRTTCKMSSILLNIFIELASKGFCIPPEFSDELDKEGISKPSDGLGLGEGQGERDVSDKIESEDQLDDAQPAGKEKDAEDDKDCKEEEKGIEMSEDFDSKLQDKEKKEDDDSDSDSGDSDAEEQIGETGKEADQQNKETFGDDKDEEAGEEESTEQKEEQGDKGEKEGEEQLSAKEGKTSKDEEDDKKDGKEEKEKDKKEINELEEPEYDDEQIDPHHGQQQELPEPEPMDLPDEMQLDDGEANDEENQDQEENPFDIDTMKTEDKPEDKPDTGEESKVEEADKDEEKDFSSDDEDIEKGDKEENNDDGKDEGDRNEESQKQMESEDVENEEENDKGDESVLDQTQSKQENIEAMEVDDAETADKAQTNTSENQKSNQPIDELQQEDRPDQEGVGQSQMEESSSGHSAQTSAPQEIKRSKENKDQEEQKRKQKPGESDSRRSLGDIDQPVRKKLKTVDSKNDDKADDKNEEREDDSEMYQHIKDAEKTKTQVLDVATKEQAESQNKETKHEDDAEEEPTASAADVPEEEKEEEMDVMDVENSQTENPEKVGETKDKQNKKKQHPQGDVLEELQDIEVEGEIIETTTVPRSTESTHHTQYSTILESSATRLSIEEINNLRLDVEKQLSGWNEPPSTLEADQAWQKISSVTSSLAQDLSEQLRLVLEPTQASRLRGDFRTGRRINMRKVIPYIASQFRKDKIWLRRTKPSKREYQIVLAIDDSSSMADNHSKELAFESVALISKALTLLESGQLSVLSFGENVEVIHKLTDPFTDNSGIKLLQKFKFDQSKTCVAKLVDFSTEMLNQSQLQSTALNAKLLVIVSDGRGVFSEGETFVKQAVRRAKLSNIFMVFVIIDNPENKNSVLDIRMPVFKDGKLQEIQSYMDVFPFSFYIILRDINSLPSVLSDALRQWFEIVSNSISR